ncbi:NACHT domain-containing protein, partial [Actinoplanes regularis]
MDADESRPENRRARPLEPAELPAGPERDLHKALYQLYAEADCPRLDELVRMIAADDRLPGAPKKDLISKIIRADGLGSQQDTVTVAVALARAAGREDTARTAERVRRLWVAARTTPTPRLPLDDLVENYLARLRGRYGQLDIDSLLPLDSQEERIPIGVREVFVAQHVRADPPPVELPRELWHRLAESGAVEDRDLPEDLDRTLLARVRQSYEARPARPVLDVLAEPGGQRTVVLGDPGAGKSTLARYLAVALAQRTDGVLPAALTGLLPVLIELRGYAEPRWRDSSFLDYLDQQHRYTDDRLGLPRDLLERLLNGYGQVLFIFDGLDELFDRKDRETVSHQITGFAARYPGARVLVTSRYVGYQRGAFDAAGFSHHMLQDLHRDQIAGFAQRWYRIACPGNPADAARLKDRLLTAVDGSRAVRELAGNPLLLTILAVIGRRRELPRDRRSVYEHAVTVLVEHWEVSKHLAAAAPGLPELDREDKLELLRLIARRMQDGPSGLAGNHIAGADLLTMFETYLRESHALAPGPARVAARAMLEQFRHRNFILSRFGGSVYGFVHRAFLEYLAAADIDIRFANRELSENDLIEGVFFRRYNDPAWHEVLLLLTGMREHFAGAILDRLLTADPLWYLRPDTLPQHLLLAIRCLAEIRKPGAIHRQNIAIARALTDLLETVTDRPFDLALPTAIRQTIVPVMTGLGPRWTGRDHYLGWYRIRSRVISDTEYSSTEAVPLATLIAAALGTSSTVQQLRTTAVLGTHVTIRRAAVQAIAVVWPDDPDTSRWLRGRVTTDPDPFVREAAVLAIAVGWPGDPDTLPLLRDHAANDPSPYVREAAVRAIVIGWPGDPDILSWLRDRAATDPFPFVREAAVLAIAVGWSDHPDALSWLRGRAAIDSDESVRQGVARAIVVGWPGDPDSLPWLCDRAATDDFATVREAAVRAIAVGWADDRGALPLLRNRATADSDESVREA